MSETKKQINLLDFAANPDGSIYRNPMSRREMVNNAVRECLRELYMRAQPKVDYDKLIEDIRSGKIDQNKLETPIHDQYYVSKEEYNYVLEKYIHSFGMDEKFKSYINDVILRDLKEGGYKDVYVKDDPTDPHSTGHRESERTPKLADVIGEEAADKVFAALENIRDWYRFDREESDFRGTMAIGVGSPSQSKELVQKYWKSQGVEVELVDRDPDLFWYIDAGYTQDDLEYEFNYEDLPTLEEGDDFEEVEDDGIVEAMSPENTEMSPEMSPEK